MMFSKEIEHGGYPEDDGRTMAEKRRDANLYAGIGVKRRGLKKEVDTRTPLAIGSPQLQTATPETQLRRSRQMTLTLKSTSKNGKYAFYNGAARVLRFDLGAFPNGTAPQTFDVADGLFAPPKQKLTPEERKAQRAAQPKPTEAERIAQDEARLQKRKEKLAKAQASEATL